MGGNGSGRKSKIERNPDDQNRILVELSKKQNQLLKICSNICKERYDKHELLQELYLRVYRHGDVNTILRDGEINFPYIKEIAYNIFKSLKNEEKLLEPIKESVIHDIDDVDYKQSLNEKIEIIKKEISKWNEYQRDMFVSHFATGHSSRLISRETGISQDEIYITIRECKQRIKKVILKNYDKT